MEAMLMQHHAAAASPSPSPSRRLRGAAGAGGGHAPAGTTRVGFGRTARHGARDGVLSVAAAARRLGRAAVDRAGGNRDREVDDDVGGTVRLLVGLPIDSVTDGVTVNSGKGIEAGIRAVTLLGADGVELQVFWSVVQPESPDRFSWAGYRAVADMAAAEGLSLRVSLRIHGSPGGNVPPLPSWVGAAAASDPDILFTDRNGGRHEDCLSFAVDELPVLYGKSPLDRYEAFFRSFADAFDDLFDSTITDVTVGLGPNGELRYPSYPPRTEVSKFTGVGMFQCYDKYMLGQLKQHAEASGQPLWGLSGPHDVPGYHQSTDSCDFFRDHGGSCKGGAGAQLGPNVAPPLGSWESPYGDFFLSWYAGKLVSHGDRVLGMANRVFGGKPVELSAKVPFMHWWHGAKSRPAEAAAGFYKSNKKNGYSPVAKMFARHGCTMIVPGMDVCMNKQHRSTGSSPDQLLVQIKNACRRHGARIAGENASLVMTHTSSFSRIRSNILTAERVRPSHFTYQRMGAEFFSPEHWPPFMEFVRSVVCGEWDEDDVPGDDEERGMAAASRNARQAQAV